MRIIVIMRHTLLILALLLIPNLTRGEVMKILEAEKAKITCGAGSVTGGEIWASGGSLVPAFWGRQQGDSLEWTFYITPPAKEIGLAVRYSYAAGHYQQTQGTQNPKRVLKLSIDGGEEIDVAVPDTGWWTLFATTDIPLADIPPGRHTLRLVSPAPHMCANVDCVILYRGKFETIPAALRNTTIAVSDSKRFVLRATPKAPLRMPPDAIFKEFERIFDLYEKFMGFAPPTPVAIHLIEDPKWPDPGATSFQNQGGVFFRAGVMDREQGNWCHEMVHMFYVAHFPWWFDESSVRTLTLYAFGPALYEKFKLDQRNGMYREWNAAAKDLLARPEKRVDSPDPVHAAIVTKYGPDVFSRFFHACLDAAKKGELDFTPGRHLTRDEIVKYMSQAAGEDVAPLYRQWTGFDQTP